MDAAAAPIGTLTAIREGLRDLLSSRVFPLAVLSVVLGLVLSIGAAVIVLYHLLPLLPAQTGFLGWVLGAIRWLAGAAVVVLSISFSPAVAMFIGGFLFDSAADRVEDALGIPRGRPPSFIASLGFTVRIAIPALVINVCALPLVFVPVIHVAIFAALNGYLMGREYFTLAALRRVDWHQARALRGRLWLPVFTIGVVAAFLPLVAPLFGASAMTRLLRGRTQPRPASSR